ncbi:MAG: hypothetical protein ACRBB6_03545 [Neptuniibacter sp.]
MIVQSSNIQMSSEHEKHESIILSQTIDTDGITDFAGMFREARTSSLLTQLLSGTDLSAGTQSDADNESSILVMTDEGLKFRSAEEKQNDLNEQQTLTRTQLWESLMKALNPDYKDFPSPMDYQLRKTQEDYSPSDISNLQVAQMKPVTMQMTMKVSETIEEYECTDFHSCGMVKTADGKEIDFSLGLTMERSYSATREFEMTQEVVFKDPLIVNFAGNAADLTDEKYEFDIDADGELDLISYLLGDSGMLALDKNGDGSINDGSELFGAITGNGFAELAEYDEDGNQFIDEADSIYADLGIWSKTPESESFESLLDNGIGAIYLGSSPTPFDIKGENNQVNGRLIASGVYLTESGKAGSIQQIDMVV